MEQRNANCEHQGDLSSWIIPLIHSLKLSRFNLLHYTLLRGIVGDLKAPIPLKSPSQRSHCSRVESNSYNARLVVPSRTFLPSCLSLLRLWHWTDEHLLFLNIDFLGDTQTNTYWNENYFLTSFFRKILIWIPGPMLWWLRCAWWQTEPEPGTGELRGRGVDTRSRTLEHSTVNHQHQPVRVMWYINTIYYYKSICLSVLPSI